MNKVELTPAFLIHRRAFKDTSLLLDFFTRDYGKIRLIGKGLRKSKTNIQAFQYLYISFSGRSNLKTLTFFETNDTPRVLTGDTLILGMYGNELISRLLHEYDAHSELFYIYQQFIQQLDILSQSQQYWLLRLFENKLLAKLGYALDMCADVNGDKIDQSLYYVYQPQAGFAPNVKGKISGASIHQLHLGEPENMPNLEQIKVCRDLNRIRLAPLLGDKPLQSRSLFFTGN